MFINKTPKLSTSCFWSLIKPGYPAVKFIKVSAFEIKIKIICHMHNCSCTLIKIQMLTLAI